MKRELYRTISLLSMVALASGSISAQEQAAMQNVESTQTQEHAATNDVEAQKQEEQPIVANSEQPVGPVEVPVAEGKEPVATQAEEDDEMTMKEFLLGRYAVHFEKENIGTTIAVGTALALAATAAYRFWPNKGNAGAQLDPSAADGRSSVSPVRGRSGSRSAPTTPIKTATVKIEPGSATYSTPGGRTTYSRSSKSKSPLNKVNY